MKISSRVRFARYEPAAVLRATGEDALTFLQGQFTQELRDLTPGGARYGLWLNQKGKIVADSFVLAGEPGEWWLMSYFSPAAVMQERLESYVIADDVTLEDQTKDWLGMTCFDFAEKPPAAADDFCWPGRRGEPAWEWLRRRAAGEIPAPLGGEEVSPAELQRLRIEGGVPAIPQEVGAGDLPNEAGLERDAISYTKGCYLGQEVMARLKNLGQVRRRLVRVRAAGYIPKVDTPPAPLFLGAKRVGEVRSAVPARDGVGWVGFAMVSLLGLPADAVLSLAADGPADVRLEFLS